MLNNDSKKFLKQVKHLLPLLSKQEKRFLKDFEISIHEYLTENPNATTEDLSTEFGTPNDIVHEYIDSIDSEYIIKRICVKKMIRRIALTILLIAVLLLLVHTAFTYLAYLDAQNAVITQEVTVIE